MSEKDKNSDGIPFSESPKPGDAGPSFETALNSENLKPNESTDTAARKSEKPKW